MNLYVREAAMAYVECNTALKDTEALGPDVGPPGGYSEKLSPALVTISGCRVPPVWLTACHTPRSRGAHSDLSVTFSSSRVCCLPRDP